MPYMKVEGGVQPPILGNIYVHQILILRGAQISLSNSLTITYSVTENVK